MCDMDLESGGKKDGALPSYTPEVFSKIITRNIFGGRMWDSWSGDFSESGLKEISVNMCLLQ